MRSEIMKKLDVGCAIVEKKGQILIAQRKPGTHLAGFWEFPGGKIRKGESLEDCLVREIREELGVWVRPVRFLFETMHDYPTISVHLYFYYCRWVFGRPYRRDCLNFQWVALEDLRRHRFVPADLDVINELISKKTYYFRKI